MLSLRFFSMGSGKMNCRLDMQNFISSKHGTSCPYIFLKQALFCPAGVCLIIPQTLLGSLGKSASVDLSYFVLILSHEQHCVMLDHSIDNKLIVCQPILIIVKVFGHYIGSMEHFLIYHIICCKDVDTEGIDLCRETTAASFVVPYIFSNLNLGIIQLN